MVYHIVYLCVNICPSRVCHRTAVLRALGRNPPGDGALGMANSNINIVPPRPRVPNDEPEGVLALFNFFLGCMLDVVRGILATPEHTRITEALGFDSTGPLFTRHMLDTYTGILNTYSTGHGQNSDPDWSHEDKVFLHTLWLNRVVPLAVRHAHIHMQHTIMHEATPDMIVGDAHHMVVKVVLALLDTSLQEALDTPWLHDATG